MTYHEKKARQHLDRSRDLYSAALVEYRRCKERGNRVELAEVCKHLKRAQCEAYGARLHTKMALEEALSLTLVALLDDTAVAAKA